MKIQIPTIVFALSLALTAVSSAQSVDRRLHRQEDRIQQGLRQHTLNRREASRLSQRDASIHRAELNDRRRHHGTLTRAERNGLNRRLNSVSKAIYREKHEGRKRG